MPELDSPVSSVEAWWVILGEITLCQPHLIHCAVVTQKRGDGEQHCKLLWFASGEKSRL